MKLASFEYQGRNSYGVVIDDGIVDLRKAFDDLYPDLKTFLAANVLTKANNLIAGRKTDFDLDDVELLPVIPNPEKIWCCGLNYRDHVEETQRTITENPTFFTRFPDSQVGHEKPIVRPKESVQFDYEGEIAVIIGKEGRRIGEADAGGYIAGYACYNDGSIRDWQRHTTQWGAGKNFWKTGSFGPWMVTSDEILFGEKMTLVTRLNGKEMQRTDTTLMIHSIAKQIAYLSTISPLRVGDVIVTGTPGGVGARREPPVWMKSGDVLEIEIDRIGILKNTVIEDV